MSPLKTLFISLKIKRSSLYSLQSMMGINFPLMDYSKFVTNVCNTASIRETNAHSDAFRLADHFRLNPENFAQDTNNPLQCLCLIISLGRFWLIILFGSIILDLMIKSQFDNSVCNWDKYYNQSTPVVPDNWFLLFISVLGILIILLVCIKVLLLYANAKCFA